MLPRHAKRLATRREETGRLAAARSVRWPARLRVVRPREMRPREASDTVLPPARRDPLVQPVAITEHCVIGDQIRVPAAWCDMAGCRSSFADTRALGEADNRARALRAGWSKDAVGQLICPSCQQRSPAAAARRAPGRESGGGRAPAGVPTAEADRGPGQALDSGGPPTPVPSPVAVRRSLLLAWRHRALGRVLQLGARWPRLFAALAGGSNGWSTPPPVTAPTRRGGAGRLRGL
jgi:hypothetical protein